MEFLPLFHNLAGRRVLVVGGGEIALRKARLLSEANACLYVVAPQIEPALRELAANGHGSVREGGYQSSDLDHAVLVIAATDDESLNAQVSADAQALRIPVNAVDAPHLCTVIFPAIVDRTPMSREMRPSTIERMSRTAPVGGGRNAPGSPFGRAQTARGGRDRPLSHSMRPT